MCACTHTHTTTVDYMVLFIFSEQVLGYSSKIWQHLVTLEGSRQSVWSSPVKAGNRHTDFSFALSLWLHQWWYLFRFYVVCACRHSINRFIMVELSQHVDWRLQPSITEHLIQVELLVEEAPTSSQNKWIELLQIKLIIFSKALYILEAVFQWSLQCQVKGDLLHRNLGLWSNPQLSLLDKLP